MKKKNTKLELTHIELQNYLVILSKLGQILEADGLIAQAKVVNSLIERLQKGMIAEFVVLINGVEMWGGSGAVWEVFIRDRKASIQFESEIVRLIDLMEETNILGSNITPIRKIFRANLR